LLSGKILLIAHVRLYLAAGGLPMAVFHAKQQWLGERKSVIERGRHCILFGRQ